MITNLQLEHHRGKGKKKGKKKKKKVRARHSSLIFKDNTKLRNIIIGKRSCGLGLRYAFRAFIIPKLL
jgi:hypothetical protein